MRALTCLLWLRDWADKKDSSIGILTDLPLLAIEKARNLNNQSERLSPSSEGGWKHEYLNLRRPSFSFPNTSKHLFLLRSWNPRAKTAAGYIFKYGETYKTCDSEFSWNMRSLENNFCFSWPCPLHSNLPFTHPLNRPHTPCSLNLVATPTRLRLAHTKPHMGYIPRFPSLWLTTQATIFYRPTAAHLHILQFSFFFDPSDWLLTKFFFNAGLLAKKYSCHVWTGT